VKLADFGIASLASDSTLTQAGTIMGTPGYMAPEQITGDPVDARADLFAVGVLAYEMLTGTNPFGASEGLPVTTIMYRIVHQAPPELPPEALAGLPVDVRPILEAALAKDPASRFPDAAGYLSALKGEGPLPAPEITGAPVSAATAGHPGGTILGRLSAIKSATMISRPSSGKQEATWRRSWVPYAVVMVVGVIVVIALIASSGTGWVGLAASERTETFESIPPMTELQLQMVASGIFGIELSDVLVLAYESFGEWSAAVVCPAKGDMAVIQLVFRWTEGEGAWTLFWQQAHTHTADLDIEWENPNTLIARGVPQEVIDWLNLDR
jgi:hypothetical protein